MGGGAIVAGERSSLGGEGGAEGGEPLDGEELEDGVLVRVPAVASWFGESECSTGTDGMASRSLCILLTAEVRATVTAVAKAAQEAMCMWWRARARWRQVVR